MQIGKQAFSRNVFEKTQDGSMGGGENDNEPVDLMRKVQKGLEKDILRSLDTKYRHDIENLHLIGWIRSGIIQPVFDKEDIRGDGLTFIHWVLPLKRI